MAKHAIDFWLTTEDLPAPRQPRHGRPRRAASTCAKVDHNTEPHRRLLAKLKGLLGPLGCHETLDPALVGPRPAHPARRRRAPVRHRALRQRPGDVGARRRLQGPRPRQPLRRRHELLPVVSSAVNPALTAMANALRVGDHLHRAPRRAPSRPSCRRWRHEGADQALAARSATASSPASLGTAAMTVSSTLEARLRHRAAEHGARARDGQGARHRRVRGRPRPGALQRPLALGLRHRLGRRARAARRDRAARRRARPRPTARRSGAARRSRCPRSTSPRRSSSGAARRSPSTSSTTPSTRSRPASPTSSLAAGRRAT